jgi:hypothetical protein
VRTLELLANPLRHRPIAAVVQAPSS